MIAKPKALTESPPASDTPRVTFPDPSTGPADEIWARFFESQQPRPSDVRRQILKLHNQAEHEHVIAALEAALINGQSQPWMYEVLALSMEIQKYPKEDIERVVLSMTDFGGADFSSMMYSAAYLVRFGRIETALKLFQQASRIAPEHAEPYILALEHAIRINSPKDIIWAACGIVQYDWSRDHVKRQQDARDALANLERQLTKQKDETQLALLRQSLTDARQRDVVIELTWNGTADLDLEVEEPTGTICAFSQPQTTAGGFHLNDGYGPKPEDCRETYVCPIAPSGEFRVRVKHAWGQLVGKRATLTITTHQGSPQEKVDRRTLQLEKGNATAVFTLENGRRVRPRPVAFPGSEMKTDGQVVRPVRQPLHDPNIQRARAEFQQSRGAGLGFVGLQPVVEVIPEGATMAASAVISADRRYVRLGISPVLTNITDVFTYTFFGGVGAGNQGAAGGTAPNR